MPTIKTVTMTMNEDQARIIINALDFYSRIFMGQFEEIDTLFTWHFPDFWKYSNKDKDRQNQRDLLKIHLAFARRDVFPELDPNAYYGIASPEIPDVARISYDIKKQLEHDVSWAKYPEGHWPETTFATVNFDKPMHLCPKVLLPKVKVVMEKIKCPKN